MILPGRYEVRRFLADTQQPLPRDDRMAGFLTKRAARRYAARIGPWQDRWHPRVTDHRTGQFV